MLIVLLRHGETAYNAQRRYQGKSDIPLSARGRARLRAADFAPDVVVVTALCRTAQTAAAVFPGARQAVEDDLREMDFGDFEGKTYGELKDDPAYRAWLASGGEAPARTGRAKRRSARGSAARLSGWSMRRWHAGRSGWSSSRTAAHRWPRSAALPSRIGIITTGTRRLRAASCWMRRSGRSGGCCAW